MSSTTSTIVKSTRKEIATVGARKVLHNINNIFQEAQLIKNFYKNKLKNNWNRNKKLKNNSHDHYKNLCNAVRDEKTDAGLPTSLQPRTAENITNDYVELNTININNTNINTNINNNTNNFTNNNNTNNFTNNNITNNPPESGYESDIQTHKYEELCGEQQDWNDNDKKVDDANVTKLLKNPHHHLYQYGKLMNKIHHHRNTDFFSDAPVPNVCDVEMSSSRKRKMIGKKMMARDEDRENEAKKKTFNQGRFGQKIISKKMKNKPKPVTKGKNKQQKRIKKTIDELFCWFPPRNVHPNKDVSQNATNNLSNSGIERGEQTHPQTLFDGDIQREQQESYYQCIQQPAEQYQLLQQHQQYKRFLQCQQYLQYQFYQNQYYYYSQFYRQQNDYQQLLRKRFQTSYHQRQHHQRQLLSNASTSNHLNNICHLQTSNSTKMLFNSLSSSVPSSHHISAPFLPLPSSSNILSSSLSLSSSEASSSFIFSDPSTKISAAETFSPSSTSATHKTTISELETTSTTLASSCKYSTDNLNEAFVRSNASCWHSAADDEEHHNSLITYEDHGKRRNHQDNRNNYSYNRNEDGDYHDDRNQDYNNDEEENDDYNDDDDNILNLALNEQPDVFVSEERCIWRPDLSVIHSSSCLHGVRYSDDDDDDKGDDDDNKEINFHEFKQNDKEKLEISKKISRSKQTYLRYKDNGQSRNKNNDTNNIVSNLKSNLNRINRSDVTKSLTRILERLNGSIEKCKPEVNNNHKHFVKCNKIYDSNFINKNINKNNSCNSTDNNILIHDNNNKHANKMSERQMNIIKQLISNERSYVNEMNLGMEMFSRPSKMVFHTELYFRIFQNIEKTLKSGPKSGHQIDSTGFEKKAGFWPGPEPEPGPNFGASLSRTLFSF
ncbi:hypothetical protein HELRODRAFT_162443 [Helobdella robusta]|uniref:DH domain-containing protein n=1 Tax=Helobdella robusta TaxID=6412 RepID=T1ESN6_HELRO|nr:hypothetical protein HELRODRAFT_162443 [Helobdella robusta]ESN98970.1 hypothetical protein HELRODRAFT_162443 [Helobdella robusta]